MSAHTPGPWTVHIADRFDKSHVCAENGRVLIATVGGSETPRAANAILIAAAPELLAVLQKIVNSVPHGAGHDNTFAEARAAIAKATGAA